MVVQVPRLDEAAFIAMQHQLQQQAAFAQIPDVVKRVRAARRLSRPGRL